MQHAVHSIDMGSIDIDSIYVEGGARCHHELFGCALVGGQCYVGGGRAQTPAGLDVDWSSDESGVQGVWPEALQARSTQACVNSHTQGKQRHAQAPDCESTLKCADKQAHIAPLVHQCSRIAQHTAAMQPRNNSCRLRRPCPTAGSCPADCRPCRHAAVRHNTQGAWVLFSRGCTECAAPAVELVCCLLEMCWMQGQTTDTSGHGCLCEHLANQCTLRSILTSNTASANDSMPAHLLLTSSPRASEQRG
jgi:hypothetical protein